MVLWGLCWKLSPEVGEGSYGPPTDKGIYSTSRYTTSLSIRILCWNLISRNVSIITRYDSISGEELSPYRQLSAGCIKTYGADTKPYQVIVHQNIPVRSIPASDPPTYYEGYLKNGIRKNIRNPIRLFGGNRPNNRVPGNVPASIRTTELPWNRNCSQTLLGELK